MHRIAQSEKTAARVLKSVAERDQFLPAVDADPPAEFQIARKFLGVRLAEIGDIGIAPDKRMEFLDLAAGGAILFAVGKP